MKDPEQAVKEYRKVLQLAVKYSSAEKEEKLVVGKVSFLTRSVLYITIQFSGFYCVAIILC